MIPTAAFSGRLVSASFLAKQTGNRDRPDQIDSWRSAHRIHAAARRALGPASSPRAILDVGFIPLARTFGFDRFHDVRHADAFLALSMEPPDGGSVAAIVTAWADRLDPLWRAAVVEAQQRGTRWCVLFNGISIRIVSAEQLYSRRYVDCDAAMALDRPESFDALVRIAGARALTAGDRDPASLRALVTASEQDSAGVCRSLREGVLCASMEVLRALTARHRRQSQASLQDCFDQSLTIVYRILFLLFAEARSLVPIWHPIYRDSYSVESLQEAAERADTRGLWDALRAMARLAHSGCRAGDLCVTPFNGRLFAPGRTPLAERRDLDDEAARKAILALSMRPASDRAGRERIVYRELGVEQLGAVYETLLDYRPQAQPDDRTRPRRLAVSLEPGSGIRKATGTFYTPQAIAEFLVRRTLSPLVQDSTPEAILALRIVDPAMGSGAFLVAACRFLAAAYEQALIASARCHASDIADRDRTGFRRLIAERCLYGVDLNPMAVQLARLSMWLTTLAADRPLSFLDHRLVAGDSLVGAWLRLLRTAPVLQRRSRLEPDLPLFPDSAAAEAVCRALPVRFALEAASDTIEQVRAKERAIAELAAARSPIAQWKRVADLWCAIWFADEGRLPAAAYRDLADHIVTGSGALGARAATEYVERASSIAAGARFFHWELEFPEVFFDSSGAPRPGPGFDAVIGNPPWDMLRADSGERSERRTERSVVAAALRFSRHAGVYEAQSDGHANRYQLFVERAIHLTRAGGRIGLVLPSGLAADHGSAALRRRLLTHCDVDAILGIDNHRAIFPIHRSIRFLLVTATAGRSTRETACRFGVDAVATIESIADHDNGPGQFPVRLTPDVLERLSGRSLAIPDLRQAIDLRIAEKAATLFPPLGDARGWSVRFGRELNATDDRGLFRADGSGWPVVDGKHIEPFRVAAAAPRRTITPADARRALRAERIESPRLAYRDVASATNRLTLIAGILPARVVSTHTVFCLRTPLPLRDQHLLCGLFNSFVVNYLVRLRVTTHVTTAIVEHLPIPERAAAPAACREVAAIARSLARRFDAHAFARLNALVARLYDLTSGEFEHVLSTFPLVAAADRAMALARFNE